MRRAKDFRYIRNLGSPTRWDLTKYFEYRDQELRALPSDLRAIVNDSRYFLGTEGTFWHSKLVSMEAKCSELRLSFVSEHQSFAFEFWYRDLKKVASRILSFRVMPSLVIQELTLLKGDIFRHALSDLTGQAVVIFASEVRFTEMPRQ